MENRIFDESETTAIALAVADFCHYERRKPSVVEHVTFALHTAFATGELSGLLDRDHVTSLQNKLLKFLHTPWPTELVSAIDQGLKISTKAGDPAVLPLTTEHRNTNGLAKSH